MKGRNIRLSLCIVSFICIAIITGCGKDSPKTTVNRFCSALKRYDFDTMRQYVVPSTSDQNMNKTDTSATSDVLDDYFKDNAKKIRYKIGDVEENGDTANITVTFDYLDARIPFSAALQDYLQQAFTSAFAGINISQEETDQMLVNLFYEKQKSDKPSRIKKSVSLQCIKNDGEWKIESVPDEIMDVMTCNLYSTFQELADSNDNNADEINTNDADSETWSEELAEDEPKDERVVVEFAKGETAEFKTIRATIIGSEETNVLNGEYMDPLVADEGTKFVIVTVKIENISKNPLYIGDAFILTDNQGRNYNSFDDATLYNEEIAYKDISPSMSQTGTMTYHVPADSVGYYLVAGKSGTNQVFHMYVESMSVS